MRRVVMGLVLWGAICFTPDLSAQRGRAGGRFWLAAGLGTGWASVSCSMCRGAHEPGMTGFVRLGGATARHVLVGGEVAAWVGGDDEVRQDGWSISGAAYLYPERRHRLYLKGGIGYTIHHSEDGTDIVSSTGFGPQLGVGYEFPVEGKWLLAPFFNAAFGTVGGGVKFNGATVQGTANVTVVQVGVSAVRK